MTEREQEQRNNYVKLDDQWFGGQYQDSDSGGRCYFICDYLENRYDDLSEAPSYTYCTQKEIKIDDVKLVCNMDCEQYGSCNTCRGFTAVRCHACEVPRP